MLSEIDKLKDDIEKLRDNLNRLIEQKKDLQDPEVQAASKMLNAAIVQYNKVLQEKTNKESE